MPSQLQNPHSERGTLDPAEVERFQKLSTEWWDDQGKFRPLHALGPVRLTFIRDTLARHFARTETVLKPLEGLSVLDAGCGGGLISEPMRRLGAAVTGIDPGAENIAAAALHAKTQNLDIEYQAVTIEDIAATGRMFDAIVCLEVVEHVPDVGAFLKTLSVLVRPGGMMILSTINRSIKSFALAIVAAEYILGWLPRGTHQWERFVTPGELSRHLTSAGLTPACFRGMVYDPLEGAWSLSTDTGVNYLAAAVKA